VDFGGEAAGIAPVPAGNDIGFVADAIGERQCIRTDGQSGKHWLVFDIDQTFAWQENARMTLVVEYWDQPAGLLTIRYDASDDSGGPLAQVFRTVRTGEPQWVQLCLPLKSCYFGNRTWAAGDIAIGGYTWTNDPRAGDVAVASIAVLRAHMSLKLQPDAVPAHGPEDVREFDAVATLWTAPLVKPADGEQVVFTVEGADAEETAGSANGVARTNFGLDTTPGRLTVSARWGKIVQHASLYSLPTDQALVETEAPVFGFEEDTPAKITVVSAGQSSTSLDRDGKQAGETSLRIDYVFDAQPAEGQPAVIAEVGQELPGRPLTLSCEVSGDGSGHPVLFVVEDAAHESFSFVAGPIQHLGWTTMTCVLDETAADDHWGPAGANGAFDLPLVVRDVRIMKSAEGNSGTIHLDDLRATWLAPAEPQ